jgi:ABC-type lipoprotein export system ATPase subunit
MNTESGADSHKLLSGGEKRIIDVCTLMGLRKLTESIHNKKFNILLLDEVLDSLDKKNTSQYLQILKKVANELSVAIITHNDNVTGYCDELYQL